MKPLDPSQVWQWPAWPFVLLAVLLILWPWFWRLLVGIVAWACWRGEAQRRGEAGAASAPIVLDSWESKWPDGE